MTFYTISQTIDFKLFKMAVGMAIRAGLRHMCKLLNYTSGAVGFIMTGTTGNACMFTGKSETCWCMIESNIAPP